MDGSVLVQTVISGALVSAAMLGFLCRFAPRRARWPQVAAGVIFLDQGSKWMIAELIKGHGAHAYLGGKIQISYCTNAVQGFGGTSAWLLCTTLVGMIGALRLYQMLAERRYVMSSSVEVGVALMLGGLAIIAAERALTGFVVDFLTVGAAPDYACNVADLAVLAGATILCVRAAVALPGAVSDELAAARAGEGAD